MYNVMWCRLMTPWSPWLLKSSFPILFNPTLWLLWCRNKMYKIWVEKLFKWNRGQETQSLEKSGWKPNIWGKQNFSLRWPRKMKPLSPMLRFEWVFYTYKIYRTGFLRTIESRKRFLCYRPLNGYKNSETINDKSMRVNHFLIFYLFLFEP